MMFSEIVWNAILITSQIMPLLSLEISLSSIYWNVYKLGLQIKILIEQMQTIFSYSVFYLALINARKNI